GAFGREAVHVNPAAAPIAGEWRVVPFGGDAGFVDPCGAAASPAAVVVQRLNDFVGEVFGKGGIAVVGEAGVVMEANIPTAAVVGVVAGDDVEFGADGGFENIAGAVRVDVQARAVGADADDAAAAQLDFAAVGAFGF